MITVIVPYKNAERWLGRCCDSLITQQGEFEFLLINDGSTDNSEAIVNEYANRDDRIVLLANEHGPGVSGARNTGLDHTHGEWVTFLDADDELLPGAYTTFTSALRIKANIHQFNHVRWLARYDRQMKKGANPRGMYTSARLPEYWFGVWNKLYCSEFVKDIRFDERTQYGEDGLFVLECLAKEDLIHHAGYKALTVKHNLENKQSLSHIKTGDDLLNQVHLYEEFMLRQTKPQLRVTVCKELSKLWDHKRMSKAFGKGDGADG